MLFRTSLITMLLTGFVIAGCANGPVAPSAEIARSLPVKDSFVPLSGLGTDTLQLPYPNPFNLLLGDTAVKLQFGLGDSAHVILLIQNPIGDEVMRYTDSNLYRGTYSGYWRPQTETGTRLRSGIYFITLRAFHADGRNFIASRPLYIESNE